ncbi:MAG TPA: helix-turn-helix transcriptional regulator [Pseudonocardiaceae bacterium]|nr:helix-turn-helix transcriptional regulator [Pseudonocardiaceae bacterium]
MTQRQATLLGRELGWRLRAAMRAADLTGQEMAERLGVTPSQISRMLTGHRASDPAEVATFLTMCGVTAAQREEIVALCRQDHTPGLLRLDGAQRWISLREHTRQARQIVEFAPAMVPWGMQTPAYTAAVADATDMAADVAMSWGGYRICLVDLSDRSRSGMWTVLIHEWDPVDSRTCIRQIAVEYSSSMDINADLPMPSG